MSPAGRWNSRSVSAQRPSGGEATLSIPDLAATLRAVFPEALQGGTYQITASVPSVSAGDPALAVSNPLPISISAPLPTPAPTVVAEPVVPPLDPRIEFGVPLALLLAGLLLNILLVRAIRRRKSARDRLSDNIELGPHL